MKPPTSPKEFRQFIGAVNCYTGMWERRSHNLALLTNITSSKVKFKWTKTKQDNFNEIKWILARDTL